MNIAEQFVVFFMSWWIVLLMVLPLGVQSVEEAGENVVPGTDRGAPAKPRMLRKIALTTVIAALIWLIFRMIDKYNLITVRDFYN